MSVTLSRLAGSTIVARLRAAGCVYAEEEAELLTSSAQTAAHLEAMVDRRVAGEPLERVVGWAEFCGLRIAVDPGVFVPRRRTELLVRRAAALVRPTVGPAARTSFRRRTVVVDLCCGSGAVGAALARALEPVELHAVDIDPVAVRCARTNLAGTGAEVYEGDLYEPLPASLQGCVDLLVVNAPYVPTEAMGLLPREARVYEAPVALDGGADGLDVQRRVAAAAPRWLAPRGHLLIETSDRQAARTKRAVARSGLITRVIRSEELETTVVSGTRPAVRGHGPASGRRSS